jgi:hypothetical protein
MMRRLAAPLLLLAALVFAAACSTRYLTRFPHRTHLAELKCGSEGQPACLSCPSCHQGVNGSHDAWAKPSEDVCTKCHQESHAKLAESIRPALAVRPAAYDIRFSHDKHLVMPDFKGQCVKCHAGAVGQVNGPPLFPPMATCLNCHEHQEAFAKNQCSACHKSNDLRGLKPRSFLAHDSQWVRRHGSEARASQETCILCHSQTQCDTCHDSTQAIRPDKLSPEAITREQTHRFDFLTRHAIEASSQPGQCVTCHVRAECDACHAQRGVSAGLTNNRSPHPLGWASGTGASTNLHGPAARRDITACAACHDQGPASNCVRCHKVGASGGSPHPAGWRSTQAMDSTACAPCHGGL